MSDEELLESLDRHFLVCYTLSVSQRREHGMTGTCPECRDRASRSTSESAATERIGDAVRG